MIERLKRLLGNRTFVYTAVIVACIANGLIQTAFTYNADLGMGDNSTFYAFARNIEHGEAVYKDFIHFRTPGTVMFFGLVMHIFGDQQSTVEIGTRLETLLLYPLLFSIAAMMIFRKRNPYFVVLAFAGVAILPGVSQLRGAVGLLALVMYLATFDRLKSRILMFGAGVLTALTFFFGQEIAVMVGACVLAGELYKRFVLRKPIARSFAYYVAGSVAGLLPLLMYILVKSSFANFVYYTTYYAFIQQPKFMDLPFPNFGYSSIVYYLPFILYLFCFIVFLYHKKLGIKDGLLLSFGILRLVTALGRSDMGHLLFSLPEVFLIVPYFIARAREVHWESRLIRQNTVFVTCLILIFALSTIKSAALVLVPFLVVFVLAKRTQNHEPKRGGDFSYFLIIGLVAPLTILIYILTPTYISILQSVRHGMLTRNDHSYEIGGVKTNPENYAQILEVRALARAYEPKTVFSFPIQPFYYSLAEKHGSRFLTFEPQTTVKEQEQTIQDLKRTQPEVIIFDPLQAQGLSGSLWLISDYITSNYKIVGVSKTSTILWVMIPNETPLRNDKLAFQLYRRGTASNAEKTAFAIEDSSKNLSNAIFQSKPELNFKLETGKASANIALNVFDSTGVPGVENACGNVIVKNRSRLVSNTKICQSDGRLNIALPKSSEPVTVILRTTDKPLIWNNPTISNH